MKSIFSKIFIGITISIVILVAIILSLSFQTIREHYLNTLTIELERINTLFMNDIRDALKNNELDSLNKFITEKAKEIKVRITIIDSTGKVLADSQRNPKFMENHLNRPEVTQALTNGIGISQRYSSTVKEDMLYVAKPIIIDGKTVAVSRVSFFLSHINDLIRELTLKILNISVAAILLNFVILWIFSRSITKPLKKLVIATRRIAYGDFSAKVSLKNRDEIGELANSFNYMIGEINNLFMQVNRQRNELNSIISSIREGFLVTNYIGEIIFVNDAIKKIFKKNIDVGKNYHKVFQDKELVKLFKKVLKKKASINKEIDLGDKYLLCSANYINLKDEIIFIFSDITEIKNLERIKRDIVANVSHELRTPLTAIKGYIETIEEEITDDNIKYYISIIKRHTARLINMVQDLLVLSELEESNKRLEISQFDIKEMLDSVFKLFEQKIKEKNLVLRYEIEEEANQIFADYYKLEQALINLIDNSIKYTEEGEVVVSVSARDNAAIIQVKDTGIGIPKEDQDRIFERFYTVDKSRSKKLGGTGLGLAIVKHIIKLHNGDIMVKSSPNKGTRFTITLPQNNQTPSEVE